MNPSSALQAAPVASHVEAPALMPGSKARWTSRTGLSRPDETVHVLKVDHLKVHILVTSMQPDGESQVIDTWVDYNELCPM